MRNPDLFSREINYQVLSNSEFNRILHRHSRLTSCGEFTLPRRLEAGALRSPAPRRGRCLNLSESQSRPPNQRTTNETRCSGEPAMALRRPIPILTDFAASARLVARKRTRGEQSITVCTIQDFG